MTLQARTSTFQKIALVVLGLALSLVFLESGLRLGGALFLSLQEHGNLQSIRQKDAYRILCIGESTTIGQYPHLLEQVLNDRNIGVRFSVIDKGRGGETTNTLLEEIAANLDKYHPDMVVAMMGINDHGVRYYQGIPDSESWLFKHCRIYRFGGILYARILKKLKHEDIFGVNGAGPGKAVVSTGASVEKAPVTLARSTQINQADEPQTPVPRDGLKETSAGLVDKAVELDLHNKKINIFPYQVEALLKEAIELDPSNDRAYFELARLYLVRPDRALQAGPLLEKAYELNPRSDIGVQLAQYDGGLLGETQKAEELLEKILRSDPANAQANFELGRLYRLQGKLPQAEEAFKKCMLNPQRMLKGDLFAMLVFLYEEMGKPELAEKYSELDREKADQFRANNPVTIDNYHKLKKILDQKGIRLVCVQYPMRDVKTLKEIFKSDEDVIFVDNQSLFKNAVKKDGFKEYFADLFAGDFGHCTAKGNELLAQNIADVILREVFNK
jgi:tetratricopeptide (TPR) repeat protein